MHSGLYGSAVPHHAHNVQHFSSLRATPRPRPHRCTRALFFRFPRLRQRDRYPLSPVRLRTQCRDSAIFARCANPLLRTDNEKQPAMHLFCNFASTSTDAHAATSAARPLQRDTALHVGALLFKLHLPCTPVQLLLPPTRSSLNPHPSSLNLAVPGPAPPAPAGPPRAPWRAPRRCPPCVAQAPSPARTAGGGCATWVGGDRNGP